MRKLFDFGSDHYDWETEFWDRSIAAQDLFDWREGFDWGQSVKTDFPPISYLADEVPLDDLSGLTTRQISSGSLGEFNGDISADGSTIVYEYVTNGTTQQFVRRVAIYDVASDAVTQTFFARDYSTDAHPDISDDGNFISYIYGRGTVFEGLGHDVRIWDVSAQNYEDITSAIDGTLYDPLSDGGNEYSYYRGHISGDGRYVALQIEETDTLGGGETRYHQALFDRLTDSVVEWIYLPNNAGTDQLGLSQDGRYMTYTTQVDIDVRDTNEFDDIYLYDRVTDSHELISVNNAGTEAFGTGDLLHDISGDGRYVIYTATNVVIDASIPGNNVHWAVLKAIASTAAMVVMK